ncbi:hypothetical protein AMECASPLE_008431 [Ameca splendens]|uniref:Uncharacterized protein n=1 Tax=Ameca splendens TaxID=208324 RepID=A0ABV0YN46_9TELE
MASAEAAAGAAQPGDGKDGPPGAMQLNPAVPIRGIRMKFAVLAGLVEVREVSNRDIVETVFNLYSDMKCAERARSGIEPQTAASRTNCIIIRGGHFTSTPRALFK